MIEQHLLDADVLVIGGGMAGLFAAIKAREQGLDVVLADKGYAGKSGSTPYAFWMSVFNPEWGHDLGIWTDYVSSVGEYLNRRTWTEAVFQDSYARYLDLVSWGVEFIREGDGTLSRFRFPGIATESLQVKKRAFGEVLRKQALKVGIKIVDQVMITDLMQKDGHIAGAVGIANESDGLHVFQAKAVVLCTGGSAFKPDGWPVASLTGDGDAMAYRAGAVISGKEFNEPKSTMANYPAATMGITLWRAEAMGVPLGDHSPPQVNTVKCVNAHGKEILGIPGANYLELEFEAHAGRAPVYQSMGPEGEKQGDRPPGPESAHHEGLSPRLGGAASGMSVHTAEGLWPIDTQGATTLPGLYAAGDSCSTMQVGAVYPGVGYALCGAAVSGARAGEAAAAYAAKADRLAVDREQIARLCASVYAPLERKGGFGPGWVTQVLRNATIPYYVLYVKHEERMRATLTLVEFMRDHLVPKLVARDAHELRLAIEAKNMILNAEMKLRASIYRQESRGTHYREDYASRSDPDWLAWVTLRDEGGAMALSKEPIPEEWWPDLSRPYEERYPKRLPGES